jgi:MFS superfamily sulfate permease-like transporter
MWRIYERAWLAKDMAAGLACLIVILAFKCRAPRVAGVLIAEVGATIVVGLFDLAAPDGVSLVGPPPRGLPGFRIPTISYSELSSLLPASVSSSDT